MTHVSTFAKVPIETSSVHPRPSEPVPTLGIVSLYGPTLKVIGISTCPFESKTINSSEGI